MLIVLPVVWAFLMSPFRSQKQPLLPVRNHIEYPLFKHPWFILVATWNGCRRKSRAQIQWSWLKTRKANTAQYHTICSREQHLWEELHDVIAMSWNRSMVLSQRDNTSNSKKKNWAQKYIVLNHCVLTVLPPTKPDSSEEMFYGYFPIFVLCFIF